MKEIKKISHSQWKELDSEDVHIELAEVGLGVFQVWGTIEKDNGDLIEYLLEEWQETQ
jgi:hypothetical protein